MPLFLKGVSNIIHFVLKPLDNLSPLLIRGHETVHYFVLEQLTTGIVPPITTRGKQSIIEHMIYINVCLHNTVCILTYKFIVA